MENLRRPRIEASVESGRLAFPREQFPYPRAGYAG